MPISHLLEDFSHLQQPHASFLVSEDSFEETRLVAFENGYKAGWEDASAAHAAEQSHIASDFAQNLQALSFTYHEAFSHVMNALKPLVGQMVETVLPTIAHQTLGSRIVSEVIEMAREQASPNLEIILSPASHGKLEAMLLDSFPFSVQFHQDESLGDGQVYLKLGTDERLIDIDGLLASMKAAVASFFNDVGGQTQNG